MENIIRSVRDNPLSLSLHVLHNRWITRNLQWLCASWTHFWRVLQWVRRCFTHLSAGGEFTQEVGPTHAPLNRHEWDHYSWSSFPPRSL